MGSIWMISLVFVGISMLVSMRLKGKFASYSKVGLMSGLSGKQVAEKMLKENGIYDVTITASNGFLTDHYNPLNKTVNLSPDVYHGVSVAAAAVAAHECGHAVQHATSYRWLMLRSRLVPVVQEFNGLVSTKGSAKADPLTFKYFRFCPQVSPVKIFAAIFLNSMAQFFIAVIPFTPTM